MENLRKKVAKTGFETYNMQFPDKTISKWTDSSRYPIKYFKLITIVMTCANLKIEKN